MKKSIFATVIASVIALTLAACSTAPAKQVVLKPATGETGSYIVGQRANLIGALDLADAKIDTFDLVIEELVPGGSWTEFRKITATKGSSSIGFALVKQDPGNYQYRAIISGKDYGPYTSATLSVKYLPKK
jgi:hypothetical protein